MLTGTKKFWLKAVLVAMVFPFAPSAVMGQAVVTYNDANGQLSIDTTGGVGGAGFNLVSLKLPGPQAVSIDRWLNGTSQDGVSDWVQSFTTNNNNGVTAEQWVGLGSGSSAPTAAVPPGVYQFATYATGLTGAAFTGDSDSGIGVGQIELGGWSSASTPGSVEFATISIGAGGLACDYLGATGCDIVDLNALYAGTNGAPTFTDASIDTWLTQASDAGNPLKASAADIYVRGDVNLNGDVDSADLGILLNNFNNASGLSWGSGNLNTDALVNSADLGILLNNFGHSSLAASAVPEPASATIFMITLLGAMGVWRRKRDR